MSTPNDTPDSTSPAGGPVDPRLLEILVCPLTKGPLVYDRQRGELVSDKIAVPGVKVTKMNEYEEVGPSEIDS